MKIEKENKEKIEIQENLETESIESKPIENNVLESEVIQPNFDMIKDKLKVESLESENKELKKDLFNFQEIIKSIVEPIFSIIDLGFQFKGITELQKPEKDKMTEHITRIIESYTKGNSKLAKKLEKVIEKIDIIHFLPLIMDIAKIYIARKNGDIPENQENNSTELNFENMFSVKNGKTNFADFE